MVNENNSQADLVITGKSIFNGVQDKITSGAIAIAGNKIIKLGNEEEIMPFITRTTKQYRFDNQLILPGFHDNHIHIFCGSLYENSVDLHNAQTENEAASIVNKFSNFNPGYDWILGFGWYHVFWKEKKLPTRFSLDKYLPDRPVFLINAELHGAWVNSKALEICGITTNTLDPPYGTIERDSKGEPTGFLYETAMGLVASKAYELKRREGEGFFNHFSKRQHALG